MSQETSPLPFAVKKSTVLSYYLIDANREYLGRGFKEDVATKIALAVNQSDALLECAAVLRKMLSNVEEECAIRKTSGESLVFTNSANIKIAPTALERAGIKPL